jgi:hypothetical protein
MASLRLEKECVAAFLPLQGLVKDRILRNRASARHIYGTGVGEVWDRDLRWEKHSAKGIGKRERKCDETRNRWKHPPLSMSGSRKDLSSTRAR